MVDREVGIQDFKEAELSKSGWDFSSIPGEKFGKKGYGRETGILLKSGKFQGWDSYETGSKLTV